MIWRSHAFCEPQAWYMNGGRLVTSDNGYVVAEVSGLVDVLEDEGFARLRGRNIAVLTHGAARDRKGMRTLDRLLSAPEVHVRAVLAPEHGFDANREGHVENGQFGAVPLYSMFGKTRRPDASMLRGGARGKDRGEGDERKRTKEGAAHGKRSL